MQKLSVYQARAQLTIGNVGDLTKDVVSTDLFITLWWADKCLTDHGDIDFSTNTPVCGLKVKQKCKCEQSLELQQKSDCN